jgi:hypothetical protein
MVGLVHQAEIARRARNRSTAPIGKLHNQIRLADERPGEGDEIRVTARDDPFHRCGSPHSADQDDRLGDGMSERAGRLEKVRLGVRRRRQAVQQQAAASQATNSQSISNESGLA